MSNNFQREMSNYVKSKMSKNGKSKMSKNVKSRAVVVAQLVERLLTIPEVRSSKPVIGKKLFIY